MKYSYLNSDIQAEGKIEVYSRASFKTAKVLYKNISLYSNIKMRNINICILLQLVLNFIIANGNHQWLLYNSPKSNERDLTDCAKLQTAPSSVHLKIHCGAENLVPLEGKRVFIKNTKRELCHLPGYLRPSTFPEGRDSRAACYAELFSLYFW